MNDLGGVVLKGFKVKCDLSNETNPGLCHGGHEYIVSDQYNFLTDGVLHGRDRCTDDTAEIAKFEKMGRCE